MCTEVTASIRITNRDFKTQFRDHVLCVGNIDNQILSADISDGTIGVRCAIAVEITVTQKSTLLAVAEYQFGILQHVLISNWGRISEPLQKGVHMLTCYSGNMVCTICLKCLLHGISLTFVRDIIASGVRVIAKVDGHVYFGLLDSFQLNKRSVRYYHTDGTKILATREEMLQSDP